MKISDIILKENDEMFSSSWRTVLPSFIKYGDQVLPRLEQFGKEYAAAHSEGEYGQLGAWADENDYDSIFRYIVNALGTNYRMLLAWDGIIQEHADGGVCAVYYKEHDGDLDEYREAWDDFKQRAQAGQIDEHEIRDIQKFAAELKRAGGQIQEASFQFDLDDEPEPPKKTQTKDKPKFSHNPFQQQAAQPLANRPEEPRGAEQPAAPRMRQATAAATRRATGNIEPTDQMRDMLSRMRNIEIDPDLADYPQDEPTFDVDVNVNTENLPAVAGQAIQAAGETSPEFHQVARLPGNMSRMIRQLGKSLFGSMTNTPTEDIYMIGNLGGQGPNTRQEVNAVANFVRENGENLGAGDIDFNAIMPGYNAETHQFVAAGIRWLLVKDFAGEYIYAWPEADSKTPSSHAQLGNEPRRLR